MPADTPTPDLTSLIAELRRLHEAITQGDQVMFCPEFLTACEKHMPQLLAAAEELAKARETERRLHNTCVANLTVIKNLEADNARLAARVTELESWAGSVSTMFGWANEIPPQRTIEMEISSVKARMRELEQQLERERGA